jgi:predicted DCC family thiol-disulfide oxidoreductase YuxK
MLVFDGDCAFCTTSARWIGARLPSEAAVQPWQVLDLRALGLTPRDVQTAAYWVDRDGSTYRGHRAVGKALAAGGGAWGLVGKVLLIPPISWLAALGYELIARNRSHMPGATDACALPASDDRVSR